MQKTEHYQLNQWEKTDRILMADFNADNAKIDAALAAVAADKIFMGSWTGNGSSSRTITLPITPKLVIILGNFASDGDGIVTFLTQNSQHYIASECAHAGSYIKLNGSSIKISNSLWHNVSGKTEYYIAFQ